MTTLAGMVAALLTGTNGATAGPATDAGRR